ncbi:SANT/Myb_domain [Hexamita inflata]|uniref:SANT/Myb domain n=1 Tax=Hexamita inflata TaxID=28002 RepID=A0AA86QJ66_9EUKA|nr:SANT/Myb domain [Hexamita inflata]CAI9954587.1 SANT/Myb domain [Hexamita inflata]
MNFHPCQPFSTSRTTQYWTDYEEQLFQTLFKQYQRKFKKYVPYFNRTYDQIRSHYYNMLKKQKRQSQQRNKSVLQIKELIEKIVNTGEVDELSFADQFG